MQTKVYLSEITNPFANLAIENDLFIKLSGKNSHPFSLRQQALCSDGTIPKPMA
jgi:hypothetical protein